MTRSGVVTAPSLCCESGRVRKCVCGVCSEQAKNSGPIANDLYYENTSVLGKVADNTRGLAIIWSFTDDDVDVNSGLRVNSATKL